MQRILLTGCAGFIGSHLGERLLKEGYAVYGVDNFDPFYDRGIKEQNLKQLKGHPNFKFFEFDLANKASYSVLPTDIDVVIHMAAKAGVQPSLKDAPEYIESNILASNNLLEFMRQHQITKLVSTSSSSVYGNNKSIPFSEADAVDEQISPYAFTKRSAELMNYTYHYLYGFDVLNLRLFTVYGPRQRPDLAIHKFIKLIDSGQQITMYGDGSTARDYTFVADTVAGFMAALKYITTHTGVFEILNLGNNKPVKLTELIDAIYEVLGKEKNINQIEMQPGDVDITYANIDKAQNLLGYNPQVKLNEGLQSFVKWYYEQKA